MTFFSNSDKKEWLVRYIAQHTQKNTPTFTQFLKNAQAPPDLFSMEEQENVTALCAFMLTTNTLSMRPGVSLVGLNLNANANIILSQTNLQQSVTQIQQNIRNTYQQIDQSSLINNISLQLSLTRNDLLFLQQNFIQNNHFQVELENMQQEALLQLLREIQKRLETGLNDIQEKQVVADRKLDTLLEEVELLPERILDTLEEKIPRWIAENVVGMPYTRFDAIASYYPSVCFLFRNRGDSSNSPTKTAQITLRFPKKADEVTMQDVALLENRCLEVFTRGFSYKAGGQRCNYVSPDKRIKTYIYCASSAEGAKVYRCLLQVLGETFYPDEISVTAGKKRTSLTTRQSALGETSLNLVDYNTPTTLYLHRVVLLINGLRRPIFVYPR